jgi:hypothetical protein
MKGSTLIEIIIYTALLSILFTGVVSSVFIILKQDTHDYENENAQVLLKK